MSPDGRLRRVLHYRYRGKIPCQHENRAKRQRLDWTVDPAEVTCRDCLRVPCMQGEAERRGLRRRTKMGAWA